jgi:hypothetical protein
MSSKCQFEAQLPCFRPNFRKEFEQRVMIKMCGNVATFSKECSQNWDAAVVHRGQSCLRDAHSNLLVGARTEAFDSRYRSLVAKERLGSPEQQGPPQQEYDLDQLAELVSHEEREQLRKRCGHTCNVLVNVIVPLWSML